MSTQKIQIEAGVYQIPLELSPSLEAQRHFLQEAFFNAQRRLRAFTHKYHWQHHTDEPFAKSFQVFADKPSFDRALLAVCGLDPTIELPATYCGALEQGILMTVAPELYRQLYPEGDEEVAFEKLLTHEMAHRLHIRILHGDEEAMGAVWFYEGFALFAAGQFEKNAPHLTVPEIFEIVNNPERGSYKRYAAVFQYFVNKAPLEELVKRASTPDFVQWLQEISTR